MKIRTGFVSNSSSSSFVILLPEGFQVTALDPQTLEKAYIDAHPYLSDEGYHRRRTEQPLPADILGAAQQLAQSIIDAHGTYEDEYGKWSFAREAFRDLVLSQMDTSSDGGNLEFVTEASILETISTIKNKLKQ